MASEPKITRPPDAWGLGLPNTVESLGVHVLPLTHGGELSVSEHDGDYQLRIDKEGGHFAIPFSALDLWALRNLANGIVAGRVREAA